MHTVGCAAGKVNPMSGHFHDEEYIARDQSTLGPDFDGREVNGCQHIPMGFDESRPGCLAFAFQHPFHAMFLEDVSHGLVRNLVTEIGQGRLMVKWKTSPCCLG